jgi:hypothetical protein
MRTRLLLLVYLEKYEPFDVHEESPFRAASVMGLNRLYRTIWAVCA